MSDPYWDKVAKEAAEAKKKKQYKVSILEAGRARSCKRMDKTILFSSRARYQARIKGDTIRCLMCRKYLPFRDFWEKTANPVRYHAYCRACVKKNNARRKPREADLPTGSRALYCGYDGRVEITQAQLKAQMKGPDWVCPRCEMPSRWAGTGNMKTDPKRGTRVR